MAAFISPILGLLDRVIPDRSQANAAKAALAQMYAKGEIDETLAQINVNAIEAGSKSFWVAGWRPCVGWCCCTGLFSQFLVRPLFTFFAGVFHRTDLIYPSLDMGTLLGLLGAILGIGVHEMITNGNGKGN